MRLDLCQQVHVKVLRSGRPPDYPRPPSKCCPLQLIRKEVQDLECASERSGVMDRPQAKEAGLFPGKHNENGKPYGNSSLQANRDGDSHENLTEASLMNFIKRNFHQKKCIIRQVDCY